MKLEPVAVMDRDGDVYKSLPCPNWHPPHTNLYSEAQLKAEVERRDAVLRLALAQLEINRTNFYKGPSKSMCKCLAGGNDEAIDAIRKALGG